MLRLERADQPARRAVASVRGNAPHTPPLVARTPATHPPSASLHQPQSPRPPCLSQRGTHTGSDRQRAHPPTIAFSSIVIVIVSVINNLPRAREAQAPAHKRNRGRAPKGHSTSLSRWHARGPDAPERKHREHHEQPIESSRPAHRHATHLSPASRRPRTERLPAATWRKQGGTMARASPTHAHLHSPGALRQGPEPGGEAGHRDKRGLAHRVAFAFCARMMALHVWRKEGHSCAGFAQGTRFLRFQQECLSCAGFAQGTRSQRGGGGGVWRLGFWSCTMFLVRDRFSKPTIPIQLLLERVCCSHR